MRRSVLLAVWLCLCATAWGDDPAPPAPGNEPVAPGTEDPRALGVTDLRTRLLGDATPEQRALAAQQLLLRPDPEAGGAIQEALRSATEPVQLAALAAVAAQRDARFAADVAALTATAKDPVAQAAIHAAGEIGRAIVPALAEVWSRLQNGLDGRRNLIAALGATRSLSAVPVLIPLLEGQPPEVCEEAVKALAVVTRSRFRSRADAEAWWQRNRDRGRERVLEDALDNYEKTVRTVDTDAEALAAENRALKAEIFQLRLEAARRSGKPETEVLLLVDLLEDKERKFAAVHARILEEVAKVGRNRAAPALPAVLRLLESPDRKVVLAALRCLGEIGDSSAADSVAPFLDPRQEADLRTAAARALSRIGTPNAVPPLIQGLAEADGAVLLAVIEGIKAVRAQAAVPRLEEILAARRAEPELAKACVDALGEIGDPVVVPILVEFLARSDPEKDHLARWAAANALGKLKQPQAVDALVALLEDPGAGLRQAAVAALGKIADRRARGPLSSTVRNDKDPVVRELAAQALGAIKDAAALDVLVAALDDAEPRVVKSAWDAALALAGKDPDLLEGLLAKLPVEKHRPQAIAILRLLAPPPTTAPEKLADVQKRAQIRLGALLFEARDWKEAEPVLETSSKWFPDDRSVKFRLGVVYRELAKADAALPLFTALLESADPASHEWWEIKLERLAVRLVRKEYAHILAEVAALLAKDPPPPADLRPVLEQLGASAQSGANAEQHRLEELRKKVLDVVARSRGADPEALKSLADELAASGREAVPFLLEVLQTGPASDWPAASHHLGVLTNIPGAIAPDTPPEKKEKAIQEWQRWYGGPK